MYVTKLVIVVRCIQMIALSVKKLSTHPYRILLKKLTCIIANIFFITASRYALYMYVETTHNNYVVEIAITFIGYQTSTCIFVIATLHMLL